MKVKEIMKQPFVIEKDIDLVEAAKFMSDKKIGSLIFVDKGKIKGIVTERDIIKNFDKDATVTEIMTKNVVTIEPNDELENAARVMSDNKIKRLPVVKDVTLVGIITATDILANASEVGDTFIFD